MGINSPIVIMQCKFESFNFKCRGFFYTVSVQTFIVINKSILLN